jgi:hypothetical protein
MIKFKYGVKLNRMKPQLATAVAVAESFYRDFGPGDMTVTSANDGVHSTNSLHYSGYAVDLRINNLSGIPASQRSTLAGLIKQALGAEWDVVHEYVGTSNEHLHVEWDPWYTPQQLRQRIRTRRAPVRQTVMGCRGPLKGRIESTARMNAVRRRK